MNTKISEKIFRVLFILAFVLGMIGISTTSAVAQQNSNPYVQASAQNDWVLANGWAEGTTVNLTINGTPHGSAVMGPASWNARRIVGEFSPVGVDIQAGDVITVEGSGMTKTVTVSPFQVLNVDPAADTVSGVANAGAEVQVCANPGSGCSVSRWTTASAPGGAWSVDFDTEFDLVPGSEGWAAEFEDDGDGTWYDWYVPNPNFSVRFHENEVHGYGWPLGGSVNLTVDDPNTLQPVDYIDTQTVIVSDMDPNQTFVQFSLWGNDFELENGQTVTMSDGTTTKTHVVAIPTVTNINSSQSLVEELAEPSSEVWVDYSGDYSGATRHETVDATGHWLADFSVPGDEDFEAETFPWMIGYPKGEARYQDEDGDSTSINWGTGRMLLELDRDGNPREVYLRHWPGRRPVSLMIDDPATPQNPDYTDTQTMFWSDGYSHLTIHWIGLFDVDPGFTLTVTDGHIARSMTVPLLAITGYDVANDTISGISDPFAEVTVPVGRENDPHYVEPTVTADSEGNWEVDLAIPSYPDNAIYDLQPGDGAEPQLHDEDWNETVLRDWSVPFDADGDGIADDMDACLDENASGYDADGNGCIDTAPGLTALLQVMLADEVAPTIKNSLWTKVNNAVKSLDKGNANAAVNQLNAFINQVEAQRGKKISEDAADLMISYAQNVIAGIQ